MIRSHNDPPFSFPLFCQPANFSPFPFSILLCYHFSLSVFCVSALFSPSLCSLSIILYFSAPLSLAVLFSIPCSTCLSVRTPPLVSKKKTERKRVIKIESAWERESARCLESLPWQSLFSSSVCVCCVALTSTERKRERAALWETADMQRKWKCLALFAACLFLFLSLLLPSFSLCVSVNFLCQHAARVSLALPSLASLPPLLPLPLSLPKFLFYSVFLAQIPSPPPPPSLTSQILYFPPAYFTFALPYSQLFSMPAKIMYSSIYSKKLPYSIPKKIGKLKTSCNFFCFYYHHHHMISSRHKLWLSLNLYLNL